MASGHGHSELHPGELLLHLNLENNNLFFFFFLIWSEKKTWLTLEDLPWDTKNTRILVIRAEQLSQGWLVQRTISITDDK